MLKKKYQVVCLRKIRKNDTNYYLEIRNECENRVEINSLQKIKRLEVNFNVP